MMSVPDNLTIPWQHGRPYRPVPDAAHGANASLALL